MAQAQVFISSSSRNVVTYYDLCKHLSDATATVQWCQRNKLLAENKDCPACGRDMHLVRRKSSPEKMGWKCPWKGCRKEVSLREGTFFSHSHLEIQQFLCTVHLSLTRTPLGRMMKEVQVCNYCFNLHSQLQGSIFLQ